MHATTEQLLELRDGIPVEARSLQHVELCGQCSHELRQLTERKQALQALPTLRPSPQVFAQLTERLANERHNRARSPNRQRPLQWAVAASVVAAIALWMLPQSGVSSAPDALVAQQTPTQNAPVVANSVAQSALEAERRELLVDRSNALEAVATELATLGTIEPSMSTDEALTALEAQLALVDYNLRAAQVDQYAPAELNALLKRRVNTLEDIVGVQRAELARQGYHGFQVMTASNLVEDQTW